ncbi:MAG TPA: hypothetical protein PLP57_07375 [Candidatus Saccharicenans sp.]|nr:hypothetical protein [Candidatus Saccharicenans sp.]HRD02446.1 hypothetical protein [Candidatus Saccharicenans sp.]
MWIKNKYISMIIANVELIAKFRGVGLKNTYELNTTGRFLQVAGRAFPILDKRFFRMEIISRRNKKEQEYSQK